MTVDKYVIEDYEARFREYEDKVCSLAADLLETRSQRAHLARELEEARANDAVHTGMLNAAREHSARYSAERDEARAEVVRLGRRLEEITQVLGYDLTDEEMAEQVAGAWAGLPPRVEEDFLALRAERDDAWEELETARPELVRLRTIIGEPGAAEAAEPLDPSAHFSPLSCQTCGSPEPRLHPAIQAEGEVTHLCPDAFHAAAGQDLRALRIPTGNSYVVSGGYVVGTCAGEAVSRLRAALDEERIEGDQG